MKRTISLPPWRVEFDRDAARQLRKLAAPVRDKIKAYLSERVASAPDPRRFGKALTGALMGLWRYRVGDFRIIAKIERDRLVILVVAVAHRSAVYR